MFDVSESEFEYPDIAAGVPEYLLKSEYIENQTEQQFSDYLKV